MNNYLHRVDVLTTLGERLRVRDSNTLDMYDKASRSNSWFTRESIITAIDGICETYLKRDKLLAWTNCYDLSCQGNKRIALILAGNIPLVGFHDLMCVYLTGHQALVKYSSKDEILIKYIVEILNDIDDRVKDQICFVPKLDIYDAVIATGSNNSSRYFKEYFGKIPHIIRKNRNGVAVLNGDESKVDIINLGYDVFTYFGLGCRNVSKLYVPENYNFEFLLETLHEKFKHLVLNHKYHNNFDYNYALFLLNKENFLMSGSLLLKESVEIPSRISSIHYEVYSDHASLVKNLLADREQIQCVVSNKVFRELNVFQFGKAQSPSLNDYADGVDTMKFLTNLE